MCQRYCLPANISSDRSCTRGMIHNKIDLISSDCTRPSIALQCRIVAWNTIHFILFHLFLTVSIALRRPPRKTRQLQIPNYIAEGCRLYCVCKHTPRVSYLWLITCILTYINLTPVIVFLYDKQVASPTKWYRLSFGQSISNPLASDDTF